MNKTQTSEKPVGCLWMVGDFFSMLFEALTLQNPCSRVEKPRR